MPIPRGSRDRPRAFWPSVLACTVAVGLVGWLAIAWLTHSSKPHVVANNISRNFRACLVADQQSTSAAQAAWSGMRDAARNTPVNAQRLIVPEGASATTLVPYVNSLVQRKCGLIISVDASLRTAVTTAAQRNPREQFINTATSISLPNVRNLPGATRAAVSNVVRQAALKQRKTR
jgi:basic membrane lipoprotein Med (substrate-binding protein (PBP1-ABC) superfamily)